MTTNILDLRPVITQPRHDFGILLGKVLSPSQPLQSEEFLRGRAQQLDGIERALFQPGRHVLIHGFRGVGKSSLAQTAAYKLSRGGDPIIISCDSSSNFASVVREIFAEALNSNPIIEKKIKEAGLSFSGFGINIGEKVISHEKIASEPGSINEAVRLMRFVQQESERKIVVIDEFDQLKDQKEQEYFTNFTKQISDKHVPVVFIFCGIGDSAEAIMTAHGSADRYFHTVELGQLPWEARFEIVKDAAHRLGIEIDESTIIRIGRISDGFPHYVHFISEMLFWRVFDASNNGKVTEELFEQAMSDASERMDMKLRGPYEKATQKYQNVYEAVLWAVADGHELKRRSADIFESYARIMRERTEITLDRPKFNQIINRLKQPSHACILTGTRQGWYEFTEKIVRGYVRLRAEQQNVLLEMDHPTAPRRLMF